MFWRVVVSLAGFVALTALTSVYVVRRVREIAPLSPRHAPVLTWALFFASTLPVVRFLAPAESVVGVLSTFGFAVGLSCALATALLLLVDGVHAGTRLVSRAAPAPAPVPPSDAEPPELAAMSAPIPRREMLRRMAIGSCLASASGASAYGFVLGRHDYVLEDVPIRLARLPRTLDGYTIVQLSDVHLGTFVGRREIEAARELVLRARPDLLVLTGDLVDHDPRYLPDLGAFVRAIAEAGPRDGVMAVLGNHDDYTGGDAVTETLTAAGVRVLRNTSASIGDAGGRLTILGVDDVYAPRNGYGLGPDLERAAAEVTPDEARVLLCHNPTFFTQAAPHVDLQLSGHTHGGQVNPLVRPVEWIMPYVAGRYVRGDGQLYVNRGFGTAGPPVRLGSAPEVTRVVLVAG